tara:strand:- start:2874 stop:3539 length:666 start_codon:yes stop_codon:yes gene_type:complete
MKLDNYNEKVELIEPWLLKKKEVVEAELQQFDPNSDDYDEKAHEAVKKQKKLLGGVEMSLAMCEYLDDSPEDTKERATYWNTMRISGSKFSDWPIESKNTGSNLTTEQKVVANHQKPLVAGIFKEVLAIDGAEMVLRRLITPSARKGGWFPLGSLEDEMNKLHDKVVKVALTDKLDRISLKVEEDVLNNIKMPPLKPKIERKPKKKAEEAPKAPESAEEEE